MFVEIPHTPKNVLLAKRIYQAKPFFFLPRSATREREESGFIRFLCSWSTYYVYKYILEPGDNETVKREREKKSSRLPNIGDTTRVTPKFKYANTHLYIALESSKGAGSKV